jgi:hypothetical protein
MASCLIVNREWNDMKKKNADINIETKSKCLDEISSFLECA